MTSNNSNNNNINDLNLQNNSLLNDFDNSTINESSDNEMAQNEPENNYYEGNHFETSKQKRTLLKVLIIVGIIIALLVISFFFLIDNTKSLASHFDNIDELRRVYSNTDCTVNTEGCDDDKTLQANAISALFDDMVINDDGTATINVSKSMIYTYVTLDVLNDLDFIQKNNIVFNQIGFDLGTEDTVNVYSDIRYKGIKAGLQAQLSYEFIDDSLIIKFMNAKIGYLPSFLYANSLPKEGQTLYEKDISYSFALADDISIKIFSPNEIKDITYDESEIISIVFNYSGAISNIIDELFNNETGNSKFSEILGYYLGISVNDINEYMNDFIDISDIEDYIELFSGLFD